jgi:hypothetical protein
MHERAERDQGLASTTYFGASLALGIADKGFGSQTRNVIVHAALRTTAIPKAISSRRLAHGEWLDFNTFELRVAEWRPFAELQSGLRAIALLFRVDIYITISENR